MNSRTAPVTVILMAALLLVACNQQQAEQEPPTPTPIPTPIIPTKPTYTVQRGDVINQVQFTGRVGPVKEVQLFFKVSGRVRTVTIERNAHVKQGQILSDLEIQPLEREVAQSQLDLERAQVNLQRAQKAQDDAIARSQVQLTIQQLQYSKLQNRNIAAEQAQAEVALEQARIAVQSAQAAYDSAPVPGRGASWQAAQLQQATLNFQNAKAAYDLTIQNLTTNYNYDLRIAAQQVVLAQQDLNSLKAGVDPLLINDVQRAQQALDNLKAQVTDAEVIAPFDGDVTDIRVDPGAAVDAFKPVFVVADPTQLEINATPDSTLLQNLKEGMTATVTLVNFPDTPMTGTLRQLPYPFGSGGVQTNDTSNTAVDQSSRVSLDPASLKGVSLTMGDLARVTVILERKTNALWLPPQAVRTFEGRRFVVIQQGDGQSRVDVKVGIESTDRVEILDGVKEGQVAVAP